MDRDALYEFSIYPFATDAVFQEGLQHIVSAAECQSPEELERVVGHARAYYFNRKTGHKITWEEYVEWKAETPLSLQQISSLIESGQTDLIPNNKVIPEGLHTGPPSAPTMCAPRKPWEDKPGPTSALASERSTALDARPRIGD